MHAYLGHDTSQQGVGGSVYAVVHIAHIRFNSATDAYLVVSSPMKHNLLGSSR